MRQTRAVVVAGRCEEDLRLVLQPAKGFAMDDPISIMLKRRPHIVFRFWPEPSSRVGALGRFECQRLSLALLERITDFGHRLPPRSVQEHSTHGAGARRRSFPPASAPG